MNKNEVGNLEWDDVRLWVRDRSAFDLETPVQYVFHVVERAGTRQPGRGGARKVGDGGLSWLDRG